MIGADGITYGPNVKAWHTAIDILHRDVARVNSMESLLGIVGRCIVQLNRIYNAKDHGDAKFAGEIVNVKNAMRDAVRIYIQNCFSDELLRAEVPKKTFLGTKFPLKDKMIKDWNTLNSIITSKKNKNFVSEEVRRDIALIGSKLQIK